MDFEGFPIYGKCNGDVVGADLKAENVEATKQFVISTKSSGNSFDSNAHFTFNCDEGMTQVIDAEAVTVSGSIGFTNEIEGGTYMLLFIQGPNRRNFTMPTGYWLNDTAFAFNDLLDDERALVTATFLGGTWYFSAKNLILL